MKCQHVMWYLAALIAVAVAALALGGPASAVLLVLVALACPVMMYMMGARQAHSTDHDGGHDDETRTPSTLNRKPPIARRR